MAGIWIRDRIVLRMQAAFVYQPSVPSTELVRVLGRTDSDGAGVHLDTGAERLTSLLSQAGMVAGGVVCGRRSSLVRRDGTNGARGAAWLPLRREQMGPSSRSKCEGAPPRSSIILGAKANDLR